ncbi:MAG: AsmA-like C-terminal region-containing protein, partial [Desulfobacterota bacterium]|nr:AsmA-like C-terminal region-containing protein [Thermodesulfobacteriota bacterium]
FLKSHLQELIPPFFSKVGNSSSYFSIKGNLKNRLEIKGEHKFPALQNLKLMHEINYFPEKAILILDRIKADSPEWLTFTGQANIAPISPNPAFKGEGKLLLELEKLPDQVKAWFPEGVTGTGKAEFDFKVEGPIKEKNIHPLIYLWEGRGELWADSFEYPVLGIVKNIKTREFALGKGVLKTIVEGQLNDGPAEIECRIDFTPKSPLLNLTAGGKDINLSREQKILNYILPFSAQSTQFTGKGSFSIETTSQGTRWKEEISHNITGKGLLNITEGTIQSPEGLSPILNFLGRSETLHFDRIYAPFRIGNGKIYNDSIRITGEDIELELKGWTSLVYDPKKRGNPIEYQIMEESIKKATGKGVEKILPFFGLETNLPVYITGTVQK